MRLGDVDGFVVDDPRDSFLAARLGEGAIVGDEGVGVGEQAIDGDVLETAVLACVGGGGWMGDWVSGWADGWMAEWVGGGLGGWMGG